MSLMSTEQVSELTGISAATLRYWRSIDKGPLSGKLGKNVFYKKQDVEAWIEDQLSTTARGGTDEPAA